MAVINTTTRRFPRTLKEAFPNTLDWAEGLDTRRILGGSFPISRRVQRRITATNTCPSLLRRFLRRVWPWAN